MDGVNKCLDSIENEISNIKSKEDPYKIHEANTKEEKYKEGYLDGLEMAQQILNDYIENHE